jgi:hypothetical protein
MLQATITVPETIPGSLNFSAAELRGRARGAVICGAFGAIWMFESLFFGALVNLASLLGIALLAVAFVVWPVTQLRSLRGWPSSNRLRWEKMAVPYWINLGVEWLACCAACIWLAHIHRYDLIPQALGIVIGVHFVPLAWIFRMPLYNWTALGMVLAALATLGIPAGHLRDFAAYGVNGLSLWVTAAVILCQDRSYHARPTA